MQIEKSNLHIEKYLNQIHCGDCLEFMKKLPDNCVDLTVTSPPYDNLRDYKNDVGKNWNFEVFKPIAKELYRITKNGGVVVWVVGDATINGSETGTSFKQALYFKEIGFNLHDTMIYKKNGVVYPDINRYYQCFEYMFVFCKLKIKTYNLIKDKKNKYANFKNGYKSYRQVNGFLHRKETKTIKENSIRENLWIISSGYLKSSVDKISFKHPAIFPEKLAEDHIISWSNEKDIVFDPMCGSGTTCKMAIKNNRNFIGCDISQTYCDIANARIEAERRQLKLPLN